MKLFTPLLLLVGLLLGACAGHDPAITSHAMSKTYTFAANSAADAMEAGVVPESAKECVKAADNIAFGYVNEANKNAQEWIKAGSEEQSILDQTVTNLQALMQGSLATIARIVSTKEC